MKEKILIVEDESLVAERLQGMLEKAGHVVVGTSSTYADALSHVKVKNPSWVLLDIHLKGQHTGIDLAHKLQELDIPFIYLSATTSQELLESVKASRPYGFMAKPFRERDLMIMFDIARYRHQQVAEAKTRKEDCALEKFNSLNFDTISAAERMSKFSEALQTVLHFDLLCLWGCHPDFQLKDDVYVERRGLRAYNVLKMPEVLNRLMIPERNYKALRKGLALPATLSCVNGIDFKRQRMDVPLLKYLSAQYKIESAAFLNVEVNHQPLILAFFSKQEQGYPERETSTLKNLQAKICQSLSHIFQLPATLPPSFKGAATVPAFSQADASEESILDAIVGKSPQLLQVLDHLKIVAPSDTSVLITGESGTGKEKIAEAIHQLSARKSKPFVVVNCAALPASLIESELFGHEKGAFTGASERRIGKFEHAEGGTIFLDEIGELPIDSQVKLLRVLQEREIERIGANQRKKIDVRIVAATNRNMEKEVAEGRFRLDLYYRLNVFPLELPPLRARSSDIPELVAHFVAKYAQAIGKPVPVVSSTAMNQLVGYPWPGNVRELAHVVERTVLLSQDKEITDVKLPRTNIAVALPDNNDQYIKSFDENERDHILFVLKKCFGKIAGKGGAAEMLRVPPTTLSSKIKRLGIHRKHILDE